MWAFDLIELNGDDMRREPLQRRKAKLADLLGRAAPGLRFNEHLDEEDGPLVFHHACKLGLIDLDDHLNLDSVVEGKTSHSHGRACVLADRLAEDFNHQIRKSVNYARLVTKPVSRVSGTSTYIPAAREWSES
jgi:hypothetical protein